MKVKTVQITQKKIFRRAAAVFMALLFSVVPIDGYSEIEDDVFTETEIEWTEIEEQEEPEETELVVEADGFIENEPHSVEQEAPEGTITEPEPEAFILPHPEPEIETETQPETVIPEESVPFQEAREEMAYIRVTGAKLYPDKSIKTGAETGTVSGITLAVQYAEDKDKKALLAVFATENGILRQGYFAAGDARALEYGSAFNEIGAGAVVFYNNQESWPLPAAKFRPAVKIQAPQPLAAGIPDTVKISFYNWDDEMKPLYQSDVPKGTYVVYQGPTPERAVYEFTGWHPDPSAASVSTDMRFTAGFIH